MKKLKKIKEAKLGMKVEILETKGTSSVNRIGDVGTITEIDPKEKRVVRVEVSGRHTMGNWESTNWLKLVD